MQAYYAKPTSEALLTEHVVSMLQHNTKTELLARPGTQTCSVQSASPQAVQPPTLLHGSLFTHCRITSDSSCCDRPAEHWHPTYSLALLPARFSYVTISAAHSANPCLAA